MDAKISVVIPPYNVEKYIAELFKVNGRDAPSNLSGIDIGNRIHAERIRRFVTLKKFREEA